MPTNDPYTTTMISINPPPLIHNKSPYAPIPLPLLSHFDTSIHPLLEIGMTPRISYDVRMHPSTAKSRCGLAGDDRWYYEAAVNPNLGSLTIRLALVERPVVVFPGNLDHGVVTVHDVLLAIYSAVCNSALEVRDQRHRQDGVLWMNPPPRSYGGYELGVAGAQNTGSAGCYRWVGLTASLTEPDVWILVTA